LGIKPSRAFVGAWEEGFIDAHAKPDALLKLSPAKYMSIIDMYTQWDFTPSPAFLNAWEKGFAAAVKESGPLPPKVYVRFLDIFSIWQVKPSDDFIKLCADSLIPALNELDPAKQPPPATFANIAHSLSILAISSAPNLVEVCEKIIIRRIKEINCYTLASCVQSLATLSAVLGIPTELSPTFIQEINNRKNKFSTYETHQLYLADQFFRTDPKIKLFDLDYAEMLEKAKLQPGIRSSKERWISNKVKSLQSKNVQMYTEDFIEATGSKADICFKYVNSPDDNTQKLLLLLQADGPSHYISQLNGEKIFDGPTCLQNALYKKNQIPYIRINLSETEQIGPWALSSQIGQALTSQIERLKGSGEIPGGKIDL
jgi:hypothetical protein